MQTLMLAGKKVEQEWGGKKKAKASGTEPVQSAEFCAELGLIVRFALARFSINPYIKGKIYILAS